MPEQIQLSPDGTHIIVKSEGPPSTNEMLETISKIADLSRSHEIFKVLVDSRGRSGQPSVADIYSVGKMFSNKFRRNMRFAVLVQTIEDDHILFENTAVNRGATINYFMDEKTAIDWLLK